MINIDEKIKLCKSNLGLIDIEKLGLKNVKLINNKGESKFADEWLIGKKHIYF